jgi:hypothetical protein
VSENPPFKATALFLGIHKRANETELSTFLGLRYISNSSNCDVAAR